MNPLTAGHPDVEPCPLKAGLTLPAVSSLLGAEMAKRENAETLGGRIARLRHEKGSTQI